MAVFDRLSSLGLEASSSDLRFWPRLLLDVTGPAVMALVAGAGAGAALLILDNFSTCSW